ncbi:hypothetical protein WKW82_40015 [Variovorax rhizosphaerae]|uniref:Uncharacterized protein n=1 Tax=Variovorax rhizosphaerae TaxID=1836200 RepID=A0ABU8WZA3_9BURK
MSSVKITGLASTWRCSGAIRRCSSSAADSAQSHSVWRAMRTPWRAKMRSWRANGQWSWYLETITCASRPAPALLLGSGEAWANAVRTVLMPRSSSQRYFMRACWITTSLAGVYSRHLAEFLADALHAPEPGLLLIAQVVFDALSRNIGIDGRTAVAASLVAGDLAMLLGWHRDFDRVLPELGLQGLQHFRARAEHAALELGQLGCQRCHLRIGLGTHGNERLRELHHQVLQRLHCIGQCTAVDGGGQKHEPHDRSPPSRWAIR